ncbi:MAG: TrkA C-terminal domain-containing protein [Candidatus Omnitrophota bacterium]
MLRDKIIESHFSSYLIETKDLGVIEIDPKKNLIGKPAISLSIPGEFMVVAVRRMDGVIIPDEKTIIEENDILMGIVKVKSLGKIKERFSL